MTDFSSARSGNFVVTILLACVVAVLLTNAGWAANRKLSGTYSSDQIKTACDKAGGYSTSGIGAGGYGCFTEKGAVSCNSSGQCLGSCQKCAAVAKGGVNGVLRPPASAGTASAAGGTTNNNKPPLHNVNQPVVSQHSGGHSSGTKH